MDLPSDSFRVFISKVGFEQTPLSHLQNPFLKATPYSQPMPAMASLARLGRPSAGLTGEEPFCHRTAGETLGGRKTPVPPPLHLRSRPGSPLGHQRSTLGAELQLFNTYCGSSPPDPASSVPHF